MLGGDLRCASLSDFGLVYTRIAHSTPVVHLERLGSLPEETVRFYVAQLSSALAFLHDNGIMHRSVFYTIPFSGV
jgi:serine/threonine protein kinase